MKNTESQNVEYKRIWRDVMDKICEELYRILDRIGEYTVKSDVDVSVLRIVIRKSGRCTVLLVTDLKHIDEVDSLLCCDLSACLHTVPSLAYELLGCIEETVVTCEY